MIAGEKRDPCKHLSSISIIPLKNEPVLDESYNTLKSFGDEALPCLVDSITDLTKMKDPRQAPKFEGFVVGDMAIIMLCENTRRAFEDQLPVQIKNLFKEEGVYAYFDYVKVKKNRLRLQREWRSWLDKRRPNS